jgi:hypothetical protein
VGVENTTYVELHDLRFSSDIIGVQIRKNEVGGACGMYGGEERCIKGFGGNLREKAHLEDGKTILK